MLHFNIITIFPQIFDSYFNESILARAQKENLIDIKIHNLRDYTEDKHQKVDDTPYGGGAGMVMKVEPIFNCIQSLCHHPIKSSADSELHTCHPEFVSGSQSKNSEILKQVQNDMKTRVILFSAKGKKYTQRDAERLARYDNLIMICGRYEGVDERVAEHIADEELSIGDYVLTGGEIPAMTVVDSVSRLIPGVLGNPKSLEEESFGSVQVVENGKKEKQKIKKLIPNKEYPQYTKPEEFNGWKIPEVLTSGNHAKIKKWRINSSSRTTTINY